MWRISVVASRSAREAPPRRPRPSAASPARRAEHAFAGRAFQNRSGALPQAHAAAEPIGIEDLVEALPIRMGGAGERPQGLA